MAKINFVGFGGLNEKYKPCYALTVNGNIYIFDCGTATPTNDALGIQKIIPDFTWIINNASNVKGIFIGTPKYMNFAALPYLIKHLPNVPIYCSDVAATIIINYFNHLQFVNKDQVKMPNIKVLEPLVTKQIAGAKITPFYVSNYLPKSFGFIVDTPDGCITFIDDFMISSNRNFAFEDQIFQINRITRGKNLALIVGVGNIGQNKGFTNPSHRTVDFFNDVLLENEDDRVLIAVHDYDVYTIMTIASLCAKLKRPFIIYSGSTNKTFQYLMKQDYFNAKASLKMIKTTDMQKTKNAVILLTGTPNRLITKIEDVLADQDELLKILPTDYFVYAVHTVNGYEKAEAEMFDHIVRCNAKKIIKMPKEVVLAQASPEDHKFLIDLLRPKYAIPINGLYMNFVQYANEVARSFIAKSNVLKLYNGEQIEIMNGELQKRPKIIKTILQYVNSTGSVDTGNVSLLEREDMANAGVCLVDLLIDKYKKQVVRHNFESIGVVNIANPDNQAAIKEINEYCTKMLNEYLEKNITDPDKPLNTMDLKYYCSKLFGRQYEKHFDKRPLVITSLVFYKTTSKEKTTVKAEK